MRNKKMRWTVDLLICYSQLGVSQMFLIAFSFNFWRMRLVDVFGLPELLPYENLEKFHLCTYAIFSYFFKRSVRYSRVNLGMLIISI